MPEQIKGPIRLRDAARSFPGKWVAVKDGEVVAVRETPYSLLEELHRREIRGAYILRMPSELDHELVGLGQAVPPTPDAPWVYAYAEDLTLGAEERTKRIGRVPLRPTLPVEISGPDGGGKTLALVDSGSEHTFAAPWLAQATGYSPGEHPIELTIGLGGKNRNVWFTDAALTIPAPPGSDDDPYTWTAQVGFLHEWEPPWSVLFGQIGLFDQFTVTLNRWAQALALEPLDAWDERYPEVIEPDPSLEIYFPYP